MALGSGTSLGGKQTDDVGITPVIKLVQCILPCESMQPDVDDRYMLTLARGDDTRQRWHDVGDEPSS